MGLDMCVPDALCSLLQIGHAGEGGLYAELIQDRSFDALALQTGLHESDAGQVLVTEAALRAGQARLQRFTAQARAAYAQPNASHGSKAYWVQQMLNKEQGSAR